VCDLVTLLMLSLVLYKNTLIGTSVNANLLDFALSSLVGVRHPAFMKR
jgi:hypothetical protein